MDIGDSVTVDGYPGIAWRIGGPETRPDEDTEWTGTEQETGRILAHMVGDDRWFAFYPDQLTPISDDDYCPECGQIGCGHYA